MGRYRRRRGAEVGPAGGRGSGHRGKPAYENPGRPGAGGGGGGSRGGGGGAGGAGYLPFDAGLDRGLSGLQANADTVTAQAAEQRARLFNENFDPNNPFSNQAMLDRELKRAHAENALSMSDGHVFSGALEAIDERTAFEGQAAQDKLERDYFDRMSGIDRELAESLSGLASAGEEAIFDQVSDVSRDPSYARPRYRRRRPGKR